MIQNFQSELVGSQFSFGGYTGYGSNPSPNNYKTPPPGKRERTKFSQTQLTWLEKYFESCEYPQAQLREQIAQELSLTDVKVQVWFKNRRAKKRQKKKFEDELMKRGHRESSEETNNNSISTLNSLSTSVNGANSAISAGSASSANSVDTTEDETKYIPQLQMPSQIDPLPVATSMPMLALTPTLTDMSAIKLESIGQNEALLTDTSSMGLNPSFASMNGANALQPPAGSGLNGSTMSWMNYSNIFSPYSSQFGFPSYSYQSAAPVNPYDYNTLGTAAPNYYMNTPRSDLSKF
ncbi:unnamed protein product [Bursaphelenchus xylophilus]|uniref:(pine wood nematode) hypothetical protein n=1 Tax=Bursaphelenchus xylophilus TaxID=6326 RepID=A0A7I8X0F1_BURXY|nr:unnamed protein product [Bursaphelenchus xylophilus]CAG9129781.1 unnamed protein product [Bursaphelenchus xylophilus]